MTSNAPPRSIALGLFLPAVTAFVIAMGIAWVNKPLPNMHDDFGNLLVADTLYHGRFSNPIPPASESLQTFHTVIQPTYASKYPIGTGAFLVLGKCLGNEAIGLWLMSACAAASIAWMVLGYMPLRWGLFAGLMTATHPFWQNGWSQEFTPGWLGLIGIALVLGGVLRIYRLTMSHGPFGGRAALAASMIAIGSVFVLYSRPFEGCILCVLLGIPLLRWIVVHHWYAQRSFWIAATPGILILTSGVGLQLHINRAVTGSYRTLPYQLHETQYGVAPLFRWEKPHEPSLGHRFPEQEEFHRIWSLESVQRTESLHGYCALLSDRLAWMRINWGTLFFFLPATIAFLPRDRKRLGSLMLMAAIALLLYNCVPWIMPHYAAPLVPIAIALTMVVLRRWIWRFACMRSKREVSSMPASDRPNATLGLRQLHRRLELGAMGLILLMQCISLVATASAHRVDAHSPKPWAMRRDDLVAQLLASPEKDLVLVRYQLGHDIMQEWVFNDADPETAPIVWARWGDEELNQKLIAGYPNRKVWILDVPKDNRESLAPWHP